MDMIETLASAVERHRRPAGGAFYAVAGIMPDGTLREIGGEGRTWPSEADYHKARGWRAGTVVTYYPADFGGQDASPAD